MHHAAPIPTLSIVCPSCVSERDASTDAKMIDGEC
jgi:hypothetical protein